jgi:hypothetical protein
MQCAVCKSDNLYGEITVKRLMPLAARGGSLKVGGHKIDQVQMKNAFMFAAPHELVDPRVQAATRPGDKEEDSPIKLIRGPIYCLDCGTEHVYVVDHASNPIAISYEEALERGYESLVGK